MRTHLWIPLALVLATFAAATAAAQTEPADEVLEALGVDNPLRSETPGGSSAPQDVTTTQSAPTGLFGGLAAALSIVTVPLAVVSQGVLDLGLGLVAAVFSGVQSGSEQVAIASKVVVADPTGSALIATVALGLLGVGLLIGVLILKFGSLAAVPLYTRIAKSELLENQVRQQIFELIRQNPGINVSEIARRLDIAWGTATHHLHKLRHEKLVSIRVASNQKCYFPNGGTYTPHEMDVMSSLKNPTARAIAELLNRHGAQRHGEIAQILGLTPALVSFHAAKLVQAGVLARHREGRTTIFTPLEPNLAPEPRPSSH